MEALAEARNGTAGEPTQTPEQRVRALYDAVVPWAIRGVIEGFYGRSWSWDERVDVMSTCAARRMTHYVYAPKDDPKHRAAWRDPYGAAELEGFRRIVGCSDIVVGFGISPGLDIDLDRAADRKALAAKVDQALACGVGLVVLALDDLPSGGAEAGRRGHDHGILTSWLHGHIADRADLALVPTDYVGTGPSDYLRSLVQEVPQDVPIGWTGARVVNERITVTEAQARAGSLEGRLPLLWDNVPVNDAMMADRLPLGALRGREPGLSTACSGYLANAMVQPRCSKLPLASIAGYLLGQDPAEAWLAAAGDLRTFAEACDGAVPVALAAQLIAGVDGPEWLESVRALAAWLTLAATCSAPGLEGEAEEWLDQVHREARTALSALRLLSALRPAASIDGAGRGRVLRPDPDAVAAEAFGLSLRWPQVRRSPRSVFGLRCGLKPAVSQWPDGRWRFHPESLTWDDNATDRIVRAAFAALGDAPSPDEAAGPVAVLIGAEPLPVADDDSFQVPPGAMVTVVQGRYRTLIRAPADPPAELSL